MHTIIIDKECGCFKKSDLVNNIKLESKDDALLKAMDMSSTMNSEFCAKHKFFVSEDNNNFLISFKEEEKKAHSGCCGGGCHS